jgi:hypothetical protein
MPDLGDALASDAAQEIIRAMVNGLAGLIGKIPGLWHRAGKHRQELITAELERSSHALSLADSENLPAVALRLEGAWEGRLRDLLAEDPAAAAELRALVTEIRRSPPQEIHAEQNITSSASGATSQGVMFGNIINHSDVPRAPAPAAPLPADAEAEGQP